MPARTRALICARCLDHHFLIQSFCVNASQEQDGWLETPDGTRHPIRGSSSLGRTADHATTTAAGLSTIARTRLALRNFKIGADHFGRDEATSFWPQRGAARFCARKSRATSAQAERPVRGPRRSPWTALGPDGVGERNRSGAFVRLHCSGGCRSVLRALSNLQPNRLESSANVCRYQSISLLREGLRRDGAAFEFSDRQRHLRRR